MYLAYDIETAENDEAAAYYEAKEYTPDPALSSVDQPPSKITELKNDDLRNTRLQEWRDSQAEKILKSVDTRRANDRAKAALHWWTGKVICICVEDDNGHAFQFADNNEEKLLATFFSFLHLNYRRHTLIGKSSEDFDKPFIIGRALKHDIGLIPQFRTGDEITDINQIFAYRSSCSQITSLANYAWGFGLEAKTGKGSDVGAWYKDGLMDVITEYCAHDTRLVAQILKRWRKEFVI